MSLVNGNKTLCVCQGTDDGRPMIHCDNCDNWYHFDCINLNKDTAAEIEQYYCDSCSEQTTLKTTFSWEQTDEELTFIPRTAEAPPAPKSRTKSRANHPTTIVKQEPSPVVPTATPTFAVEESDDDAGDKDDDGEYTGERQLTRIRRGRQIHQVGSDSDRSPSPDARARKRKAPSTNFPTPKRKRTLVAKSLSPLSDPVRKYCYGKLHEVIEPIFLEYRASQDGVEVDDETTKSLAAKYTATLENAVFGQNAEPDKKGKPSAGTKYKERFRMLTYNVGQADRISLRRGIGTGSISATTLSEMSSADLANEQLKQDMEKAAQEALHQSILKEQTSLPRAKITHKGEEIIESNNSDQLQVAREEEERERTRTRLRLRTGSILEGPESAAAISSAAGAMNSAFGERQSMDVDSGTPLSPENNISPNVSTRPAIMSPLSPVTPFIASHVISSPVQETTSPVEEDINAPRISSHQSRPSFDLNALWSGGGLPSSSMGVEGGLDDEDVAMDLEDDQPGEQDFGIFLNGVEEKRNEVVPPPKTTTPPLPPPVGLATLPVVWSGELVMPFDPDPALINTVSVKQAGGRPLGVSQAVWNTLFRNSKTVIDGRVPTDRATKYLLTTRLNSNKELIAVVFEPLPSSTKQYQELIDFLIKKDRHGLVFPWGTRPSSSAPGKDMYLVPLRPSQPLPEFIELLDHVQIPKNRDENLLIGVFVLYKGKVIVPPPPTVVAEKPVFAAPATQQSQPPLPTSAVSSLLSSFASNPAILPTVMPSGMHPVPIPAIAGMMPPPMQAPGLAYPYAHLPPSMPIPPQPVPTPPTDALTDLTSAIKSMTPEQINLIMKGLSMAGANTGVLPPAQPAPFMAHAYPPAPPIPNYNSYGPQRSPSYPPPVRSPERDADYSRDRERRSSPPPRGGRNHPRERDNDMGRGRGGPRDRRGQDLPPKEPDNGWRRRSAAPTGYGQNQ